ncbi:TIGR01777 family oxidoreductase [Aliivibrio kagoshimensis]|uniref:TIGR01777 family oxidoreductase n=1 Tax=Aliivibrio kagoshimensis TaxID=2910230 RepID=UPI003D0B39E3
MKILLTGASGFIGSYLLEYLKHHTLVVLTRSIPRAEIQLSHITFGNISFIESLSELEHLDDIDAIINLAGEPIFNKRWSTEQKDKICQSRWDLTKQLVEQCKASSNPPHIFISGSAVGFYGDQQSNPLDENHSSPTAGFTHMVCDKWEKIANQAQSEHTRVCTIRTGVVLGKKGGALAKMLLPYQCGLGGPIGDGKQYMPWIHIEDMVQAIVFLLNSSTAQGVYNLTSPHPVSNIVFSRSLANTLRRPHFLFTPTPMIKLVLGESSVLLLDSIKAKPKHLVDSGFHFHFPRIETALKDLLK